jgi:hypothetical protein
MALLDACVQLAIAARIVRQAPQDGVLLPFRIERAVFHASGGAARSGVAVVRHRTAEASRAVADVVLADHDGTPLLEITGLELRAVSFRAEQAAAEVYADAWEPATGAAATGTWIVLGDRPGRWRQVAAALEASGSRCVAAEVDPADAEGLAELFGSTGPANVLHCLGLDAGDPRTACAAVPALVRAAESAGWTPGAVVLLTSGAVAVHDAGEVVDPHGTMLWGLGRSAVLEAPQLGVRLLDLDPHDFAGAVRMLPEVLAAPAEPLRPVPTCGSWSGWGSTSPPSPWT